MSRASQSAFDLRRGSAWVLMCSIVLAGLADALFYNHLVGWTAGLFTLVVLAVILLRPCSTMHRGVRALIALAIAGLAVSMVEEPTPLSEWVTCVAIVVLAMTARGGWTSSPQAWFERWMKFLVLGPFRMPADVRVSLKWRQRHPGLRLPGQACRLRAIGMWVVPLLLGGVFVALFAAANPIVEEWATRLGDRAFDLLASFPRLLDAARICFWIAVIMGSWSLLRVRGPRKGCRAYQPPAIIYCSTCCSPSQSAGLGHSLLDRV